MSNGIDPLKDIFQLSSREKQALELATSLIGTVSSVWETANTVKSVLTSLGVLSDADPVAELRQHVDHLKQQFNGVLAALDTVQSMRAVADQVQSARTQLENLTQFAPEDPSAVGVDATWDQLRPLVLNNSLQAVNTLGDPIYWKRVFFPELLYPHVPGVWPQPWPAVEGSPGLPSGLVFDYRLTLPAYLEVVSIRLTILVAVVKNYRQVAKPELVKMATTLEGYFKKIRNGIRRPLGPPLWRDDSPENPFGGVESWSHSGALVGAVEIYSACHQVEPWPVHEFPRANWTYPSPESLAQWEPFLVRYAVRDWVRFKRLYDLIGLNAVADALVKLKRLAGIVPATLPDPEVPTAGTGPWWDDYTFRKIRDGRYSLVELAQMIHDIPGGSMLGMFVPSPPRNLLVSPLSMSEVLHLMQRYRAEPYTSFREAFQQ